MIIIWLATLLVMVNSTSTLEKNCLHKEIPKKFGIITTTFIRKGVTKMFIGYLQRYAESDCPLYDNIYIIWNNPQSPQQMGVLQNKQKWKKNVFFMQTIQNSLDFKYIIPPWAKQQIFFSMDDDFGITCQTLTQGFNKWRQVSYGQLGPLTSFYGRSFVFNPETQSFTYIDQIKLNKKWKYYHFGLTGISFISRHLLDLYYSDIFQIKQMRKQVVQKMNCEDLLLNFLTSYLYPQLIPLYLDLKFQSFGMVGVSATKTHGKYRADCISTFSDILGYNPVRYIIANISSLQNYKQKSTYLHQKCMVNLKQQYYQQNFINSKAYYLYIKSITGNYQDQSFIYSQNQKLKNAKNDITLFMNNIKKNQKQQNQIQKQNIIVMEDKQKKFLQDLEMKLHYANNNKINYVYSGAEKDKKITNIQKEILSINTDIDKLKIKNLQQSKSKSKENQKIKQTIKQEDQSQQKKLKNDPITNILYLAIFTIVFIIFMGVSKYKQYKSKKYETIPLNNLEVSQQLEKKNVVRQISNFK